MRIREGVVGFNKTIELTSKKWKEAEFKLVTSVRCDLLREKSA
ncbi:MAG: hypothetical protein ACLRZ6_05970 [Lachnospiraceae bacterium]